MYNDLLFFTPEINTTLWINYTPIKIFLKENETNFNEYMFIINIVKTSKI